MIPRRSIAAIVWLVPFIALLVPRPAAGQFVPVTDDILLVDLYCCGVITHGDVFEKIIRSGPSKILGDQMKRFHYAVASDVLYPITEDHFVIRLQADCAELFIPESSGLLVEWNGETWEADSLFTIVYDIEDDWLTPHVVPLGEEKRTVLRPFQPTGIETASRSDVRRSLMIFYYRPGEGPSKEIQVFAAIPVLSERGVPWTNRYEEFHVSLIDY